MLLILYATTSRTGPTHAINNTMRMLLDVKREIWLWNSNFIFMKISFYDIIIIIFFSHISIMPRVSRSWTLFPSIFLLSLSFSNFLFVSWEQHDYLLTMTSYVSHWILATYKVNFSCSMENIIRKMHYVLSHMPLLEDLYEKNDCKMWSGSGISVRVIFVLMVVLLLACSFS